MIYENNKLSDPRKTHQRLFKNINGWFFANDKPKYYENLFKERNIKSVLEIGSWLGQSTIWFADRVDYIIAIDTWKGAPEHKELFKQQGLGSLDELFDQFLSNIEDYDNIFPIRMSSLVAHNLSLPKVDFVYIDGDHSYPVVYSDIKNYRKCLNENGVMYGDDFQIPDVTRALVDYCNDFNMGFKTYGNQWKIVDPKREKIETKGMDIIKGQLERT